MQIETSDGTYDIEDDDIVTDNQGDLDHCNIIIGSHGPEFDTGDCHEDKAAEERAFDFIMDYACEKAATVEEYTFGQFNIWCSEASEILPDFSEPGMTRYSPTPRKSRIANARRPANLKPLSRTN